MAEKSLENLLNPNKDGGLGDLVRHAREMGDLVQALQQALPPDDRPAIVAANVRGDGELVILAATPAWASRLRFETEALLQAARATGTDVSRCTVRVNRG